MPIETKAYWEREIFFCDGRGYGLTETLRTICLGKEEDIKKFLLAGELNNELNPIQRQVLSEIREEQNGIRERDMVGGSNDGIARGKQKATGIFTPRERLALRSSHKKHNRLFRR